MRRPTDGILALDVATLLRAALRWWFGEICALVPAWLRHKLKRRRRQLVLDVSEDGAILGALIDDHYQKIMKVDPTQWLSGADPSGLAESDREVVGLAKNVIVRLADDQILQRIVEIPATTKRTQRQALAFELERQTPFAVDQVYYDHRLLSHDKTAKRMKLALILAKRATVEHAAAATRRWGLEPLFVGLWNADTQKACNLLPATARVAGTGRVRLLNRVLAGFAVALALATAVSWLWHDQQVADSLSEQLVAARRAAQETDRLRKEIEQGVQHRDFLVRQRNQLSVIKVLNDTTQLLPDGAWAFEFELSGHEARIHGFSDAASSLIGLFDQSPSFANARFRSPLTQASKNDRERFDLSFELRRDAGS